LSRLSNQNVVIGDWYQFRKTFRRFSIIGNPPYSQLPVFAESCFMDDDQYIALLMPIEELAGKQSSNKFLLRVGPPRDLIPIPHRVWPNVRGVAWFVWQGRARTTRIHL
jgi:hypothetical protein